MVAKMAKSFNKGLCDRSFLIIILPPSLLARTLKKFLPIHTTPEAYFRAQNFLLKSSPLPTSGPFPKFQVNNNFLMELFF